MKLIQQAMEDHYEGLVDNEAAEKLFNTRSAGIRTVGNVTIPYFEKKVTIIVKNIYVKKSSLTAGYNKINNKIF